MTWFADHWLAGVLLIVYTAVLLYHARIGAQHSHNMTEYYVGGRSLGGVVVGISFFATFASTNSYIGHTGKGYEYGVPWMTMAVLIVVFTWLSWTVVAPRLRRFTSHWDALTLPDYLEARFGAHNRALRLAMDAVVCNKTPAGTSGKMIIGMQFLTGPGYEATNKAIESLRRRLRGWNLLTGKAHKPEGL